MGYSMFFNRNTVLQDIDNNIKKILDKTGIFYRFWSRIKSDSSIDAKFDKKKDNESYQMQDLIGCRIVCYFDEDTKICEKLIKNHYKERTKDRSIDEVDSETFKPIRRNYVFEMPQSTIELFDEKIWNNHFDKTFECQFRTVLSEGWHEVEHDLRYKHNNTWESAPILSRELNGILATLQTSEWTLIKICDDLAYKCYKEKDWDGLIRNKVRIRLEGSGLSQAITSCLDANVEIAKKILNYNKEDLILFLSKACIPLNYDNIVYSINLLEIQDASLEKLTPKLILELYGKYY